MATKSKPAAASRGGPFVAHLKHFLDSLDQAHELTTRALAAYRSSRAYMVAFYLEDPDEKRPSLANELGLRRWLRSCLQLRELQRQARQALQAIESSKADSGVLRLLAAHKSRHHDALDLIEPWVRPFTSARLRRVVEAAASGDLGVANRAAVVRLWSRLDAITSPNIESLSEALSLEYRGIRDVIEGKDGIWLRWSNLPSSYRRIYDALENEPMSAKQIARHLGVSYSATFRQRLSDMSELGLLRKGYRRAVTFHH